MITQIYKKFTDADFISLGKNNINHPDIKKAFQNKKGDYYTEIYKERWGYSIYLYGSGFMRGMMPTIIDIENKHDLEELNKFLAKSKTFKE